MTKVPFGAQHTLQVWPSISPASTRQPDAALLSSRVVSDAVWPEGGLGGDIARAAASGGGTDGSPKHMLHLLTEVQAMLKALVAVFETCVQRQLVVKMSMPGYSRRNAGGRCRGESSQ